MLINNTNGSNWGKWDLHVHSNASDGKHSPEQIIAAAKEKGLSVIALTDHHTVKNIDEIKKLGKESGITVIAGIEFRTEYGQKSVHMIGLFPDEFDGQKLTQEVLDEQILCVLNLSRSEIIATARRNGEKGDDDSLFHKGMFLKQVDFKTAANLIHKYGGLVSVHAGSKKSSIEDMRHAKKNGTELKDALGTLKVELMQEYIDICEVPNPQDSSFYIKQFNKVAIMASNAHEVDKIGTKFTWIKAEPHFDGLRQIIFEPETRVKLQERNPEEKSDYLCIKSIKINNKYFGEQEIPFNKGLNTIIGGRSSGKSILLACVAKLSGYNKEFKKDKNEYNQFINEISKDMVLSWMDENEIGRRKIDYFPQNYINDIASNPSQITRIIERLFYEDTQKASTIKKMEADIKDLRLKLRTKIDVIFSWKSKLVDLETELQALGNKLGLEKELSEISDELQKLELDLSLTDEERQKFEVFKSKIDLYSESKTLAESNLEALQYLNKFREPFTNTSLEEDIDLLFNGSISIELLNIYNDISRKANETWNNAIDKVAKELDEKIEICKRGKESILNNIKYKGLREKIKQHSSYVQLQDKYHKQKMRLEEIKQKESEKDEFNEKYRKAIAEIINLYKEFYLIRKRFCADVCVKNDNLIIEPMVIFAVDRYNDFCEAHFYSNSISNQNVIRFQYNCIDEFMDHISKVISNLSEDKYKLKKATINRNIIEELLTTSFFDIQYNIQYQDDNLREMSEGKIAFVILRLLLDFSNNDFPILIDQPEDDLDNRAIYEELVTYLRNKKVNRQIILVTHNPNIVVGADAEEVIVANQQGNNSLNPDRVKFAYYSGALEDSFNNDKDSVLLSKGIREHVCELLEGGTKAFRLREKKYQFKLR